MTILNRIAQAMVQLSDSTTAYLEHDDGDVLLKHVDNSQTITVLDVLPFGDTDTTYDGDRDGLQVLALVVDRKDNLYVAGPRGSGRGLYFRMYRRDVAGWSFWHEHHSGAGAPERVNNVAGTFCAAGKGDSGEGFIFWVYASEEDGRVGYRTQRVKQWIDQGDLFEVSQMQPRWLVPTGSHRNATGSLLSVSTDVMGSDRVKTLVYSQTASQRVLRTAELTVGDVVREESSASTQLSPENDEGTCNVVGVGANRWVLLFSREDQIHLEYWLAGTRVSTNSFSQGFDPAIFTALHDEGGSRLLVLYWNPSDNDELLKRAYFYSSNELGDPEQVQEFADSASSRDYIRVSTMVRDPRYLEIHHSKDNSGDEFVRYLYNVNYAPFAPLVLPTPNFDALDGQLLRWVFQDPNPDDEQSEFEIEVQDIDDPSYLWTETVASSAESFGVIRTIENILQSEDSSIYSYSATWSTARSGGTRAVISSPGVTVSDSGTSRWLRQSFLEFDTSSLSPTGPILSSNVNFGIRITSVITSVNFRYHMYGSDMGTLSVQVYNGATWDTVWSISGQQQTSSGDNWIYRSINIAELGYVGEVRVRFHYEAGPGWAGDAAIDFVSMGYKSENFDVDLGDFFDGGGDHSWTRQTGGTPSGGTGPNAAHNGTHYVYCETSSPVNAGDTFILEYAPIVLGIPWVQRVWAAADSSWSYPLSTSDWIAGGTHSNELGSVEVWPTPPVGVGSWPWEIGRGRFDIAVDEAYLNTSGSTKIVLYPDELRSASEPAFGTIKFGSTTTSTIGNSVEASNDHNLQSRIEVISGLKNDARYRWRVRVKDTGGLQSPWSRWQVFETVTKPIPAINVVGGADPVMVSWSIEAGDQDHYRVQIVETEDTDVPLAQWDAGGSDGQTASWSPNFLDDSLSATPVHPREVLPEVTIEQVSDHDTAPVFRIKTDVTHPTSYWTAEGEARNTDAYIDFGVSPQDDDVFNFSELSLKASYSGSGTGYILFRTFVGDDAVMWRIALPVPSGVNELRFPINPSHLPLVPPLEKNTEYWMRLYFFAVTSDAEVTFDIDDITLYGTKLANVNSVYDSGLIRSGETTHFATTPNANGEKCFALVSAYNKEVEGRTAGDFYHGFVTPEQPSVTVDENDDSISITVLNSDEGLLATENWVYRREAGHSDWTRIATGVAPNDTFNDFTAAPGTAYEYQVEAIAEAIPYPISDLVEDFSDEDTLEKNWPRSYFPVTAAVPEPTLVDTANNRLQLTMERYYVYSLISKEIYSLKDSRIQLHIDYSEYVAMTSYWHLIVGFMSDLGNFEAYVYVRRNVGSSSVNVRRHSPFQNNFGDGPAEYYEWFSIEEDDGDIIFQGSNDGISWTTIETLPLPSGVDVSQPGYFQVDLYTDQTNWPYTAYISDINTS